MIYTHKTDLLRQAVHLVTHGYIRWTSGIAEPKKLEALILKFQDRYQIDRTAQQRWRAKKKGLTNASFIALADGRWWLFATPGEGLVSDLEQLKDATKKTTRLEITGYELVKVPRKENTPAWTWRMTKTTEENWVAKIKEASRHKRNDKMRQVVHSLARVPGFSQARRQAFRLAKYAQNEWKRTRREIWPFGEVYVGWVGAFRAGETVEPAELSKPKRTRKKEDDL